MSSSSSAERTPLHELVVRALDDLARGHPAGYERLLHIAGELAVLIELVDEPCVVAFGDGEVRVDVVPSGHEDVVVRTDRATVAAVLAGDDSLAEALDRDDLAVRGALTDVVRALDVLRWFVVASVHVPSQQDRLAAFVAAATPGR